MSENDKTSNANDGSKSGTEWADLVALYPDFAQKEGWQDLSGEEWIDILSAHPEFADKCDWSKVGGPILVELLAECPEFADKCNWAKVGAEDLLFLLRTHPQIADKCDWAKLPGGAWPGLLKEKPQFADKCNWSKLAGYDWALLLRDQPRFADKCDWGKLRGGDWVWLLAERPEFADKCDWSKPGGREMVELLTNRPEFAGKCDWSKLSGEAWSELLRKLPEFANKCDWSKLDGGNWANLLRERPGFADKCDWLKLDGRDWHCLLRKRPEFADKCDWSKLDGGTWIDMLVRDKWYGLVMTACARTYGPMAGSSDDSEDPVPRIVKNAEEKIRSEKPGLLERCNWGKLSLRETAYLLHWWPDAAATAKQAKGIRGRILEFQIRTASPYVSVTRQELAPGERPEEPGGIDFRHAGTERYADASEGVALRVFLDGAVVFDKPLDPDRPDGLAFEDLGRPFEGPGRRFYLCSEPQYSHVSYWMVGGAGSEFWDSRVVVVPEDFRFEPEKLAIPFSRMRIRPDRGPSAVIRPPDIRYGEWNDAGDPFRFSGFQNVDGCYDGSERTGWIVENGVAEPYEGPWADG